jgi:hypothetical protein
MSLPPLRESNVSGTMYQNKIELLPVYLLLSKKRQKLQFDGAVSLPPCAVFLTIGKLALYDLFLPSSQSGVGTTCFYHVVIKIRHLFLRPARLPDVNPPLNWSGC